MWCLQGCHFDPATQNIVLEKLQVALQEAGLLKAGVSLAASDETSIDTAVSTFQSYSPAALKAITQVNAHAVRPLLAVPMHAASCQQYITLASLTCPGLIQASALHQCKLTLI